MSLAKAYPPPSQKRNPGYMFVGEDYTKKNGNGLEGVGDESSMEGPKGCYGNFFIFMVYYVHMIHKEDFMKIQKKIHSKFHNTSSSNSRCRSHFYI